jgi:hypothetical protein
MPDSIVARRLLTSFALVFVVLVVLHHLTT